MADIPTTVDTLVAAAFAPILGVFCVLVPATPQYRTSEEDAGALTASA